MVEKNKPNIRLNRRPDVSYVAPHVHNIFELVYIVNGEGVMSIHNRDIDVGQGDLLFYDMKVMHALNKKDNLQAINLSISPEVFEATGVMSDHLTDLLTLTWFRAFSLDEEKLRSYVHLDEENQVRLVYLLEEMLREQEEKVVGYERILFGYVNVIFTILFRQLNKDTGVSLRQAMPGISDKVIQYIEDNYNKKISLTDLAKESYYQPSYFSSIFKECYGLSPMKYINRLRIEKAMYELTYSKDSVSAVMKNVGINDRKHFYTLFKDQVGCTPGYYRKKYNKPKSYSSKLGKH